MANVIKHIDDVVASNNKNNLDVSYVTWYRNEKLVERIHRVANIYSSLYINIDIGIILKSNERVTMSILWLL